MSGALAAAPDYALTALGRQLFSAIEIPNINPESNDQNNASKRENEDPSARLLPDGDGKLAGHGHILAVADRHEHGIFARLVKIGGQGDNARRIILRRQIGERIGIEMGRGRWIGFRASNDTDLRRQIAQFFRSRSERNDSRSRVGEVRACIFRCADLINRHLHFVHAGHQHAAHVHVHIHEAGILGVRPPTRTAIAKIEAAASRPIPNISVFSSQLLDRHMRRVVLNGPSRLGRRRAQPWRRRMKEHGN
jgi:hypothetical protein